MDDAPGAATSLPLWRVERILYDADGFLLIDKPTQIPVYGGEEGLRHGVVDRLVDHFASRDRQLHLSVHQRLDQGTSGVLCFVTDPARNVAFARAMKDHQIERRYLAVVGPPRGLHQTEAFLPDSGRIEVWLRHERGRTEVFDTPKAAPPSGAQRAVTRYRVLRRVGERVLLELFLETGRTHQIRATMAHQGHPVVGDRLYAGAVATRLMLHAESLQGGPLPGKWSAPMPEEFDRALSGYGEFPRDFERALADAATLRAPLLARTSAFRLVNDAGDGLPGFTVDVYGRFAALNLYDATLRERATELGEAIVRLGYAGVYLKERVRADLRGQQADELAPKGPLCGKSAPSPYWVDEYGMQVQVDLEDGLSTGLFVDMRENRFRARGWARGGRMLNLFCYTCSFSVSAALSGATTTNVDLSGRALARGRENFQKNGLDPHQHRFFKEDALKFLPRAVRRGEKFDFIVLDPPSFATVGKGTFSVKNKYGLAVADCLRLLSSGGRLLCVTNHRKTTPNALRKTVQEAALKVGVGLRTLRTIPGALDVPDGIEGPFPSQSLFVEVE